MRHLIKYWILLVVIPMITSCGSSKELINNDKLPRVKDEVLIHAIDSMHRQHLTHFYSKLSTKYEDSARSTSFKTSVRLKSDSVLNAVITFANIPIINALLTNDSLFISNRKDKCYSKESIDHFRELFGVNASIRNLEELLLGIPVGYDPELNYKQIDREGHYLLSSHNKREIRRNEKKNDRELITIYALSPDIRSLEGIIIESPLDTATIEINYVKREMIGTLSVPLEVAISITTAKQIIRINLEYGKTRIDEAEDIHFVIPEEYEVCK